MKGPSMTHAEWLERYRVGPQKLRQALTGLEPSDLDAHPGPGAWSIRQLVIHLQDSELVYLDRMKRVVAEDNPTLIAFDENRFVDRLLYPQQSIEDALTLIEVGRRQWLRVLAGLPQEAYQRCGTHSQAGPMTLQALLHGAVEHLEHHLGFLLEKRRRLGKPLT
jgi:uncharacterized damage-inducible protein DinB